MNVIWRPTRFIDAEVAVFHRRPPAQSKKPGPPDSFEWDGRTFTVQEVISIWARFERRGRMAANLKPAHTETALRRGSWGVGRFYFRVQTSEGVYDLYYDRAPDSAGDRAGHWFLWREVERVADSSPDDAGT